MAYTSKYAESEMNKAVKTDPDKKKKKKSATLNGKSGEKMSRKEAKDLKSRRKEEGHASGKMSTRKIKKYGRKASF